jgi:hypothetical protein
MHKGPSLISRLEVLLSEAEDNIIRANVALSDAKRAKAYWQRAIAAAKGDDDFQGEVPALQSAVRGASLS